MYALRRADAAGLTANLAALERGVKPGPEPAPRLLASAKLLSERVDPNHPPDEKHFSRAQWGETLDQLTDIWRLPGRLSAFYCQAHQQRGVTVPERCQERVRRALETELLPVTQVLSKAASGMQPKELGGTSSTRWPATSFCWAHVRRKFFEAKQFAPACEQVLELIGEVYAIEADLPGWYALTREERQAALAQRLAVRQQHSAPVVERIRQWALAQRAAPGSAFRKALDPHRNGAPAR